MALRLKPVARSLSVRAEFLGLELEDWGFVIAWAIVMRLIADHIHRVFVRFIPVSTVMTYGSAALLVVLIHWAKHGKPRGYLVAWIQHYFRPRAHAARCGYPKMPYLIESDRGQTMIEPSAVHLVAFLIGALGVVTLVLAVLLPQAAAADCRSASKTEDRPASALARRVPILEIRDSLIVRWDGSFCAGWECSGVATQFASAQRLEVISSALDAFIKGIRHPEIELQFRYVIDNGSCRVDRLSFMRAGRPTRHASH